MAADGVSLSLVHPHDPLYEMPLAPYTMVFTLENPGRTFFEARNVTLIWKKPNRWRTKEHLRLPIFLNNTTVLPKEKVQLATDVSLMMPSGKYEFEAVVCGQYLENENSNGNRDDCAQLAPTTLRMKDPDVSLSAFLLASIVIFSVFAATAVVVLAIAGPEYLGPLKPILFYEKKKRA